MFLIFIAKAEPVAIRDSGGGGFDGCQQVSVVATTPRPGQTDVPPDVTLAFAVEGDCFVPEGFSYILFTGTDDVVESWDMDWADQGADGIFRITPTLEPDTEYDVTITPTDGSIEQVIMGFTTGSGTVSGLTGAPVVSITSAVLDSWTDELTVTYVVTPATDPQLLSLLAIEATGAARFTHVLSPFGVQDRRETVTGEPGELCITAREYDGAGVVAEGNTACIEVEVTGCGCGTPSAPAAGLALLGALALARRSRTVE